MDGFGLMAHGWGKIRACFRLEVSSIAFQGGVTCSGAGRTVPLLLHSILPLAGITIFTRLNFTNLNTKQDNL